MYTNNNKYNKKKMTIENKKIVFLPPLPLTPLPPFFLDRSVDVPLCRTPQIILQLFAKKWKQLNQRDKCNN